ncbi:protein LAZ1 homolog 2-like [Nicotiana tabacum]|uniref:Protein LAZ1 homolog 2-like n=1 Tax=Nicotiana tabacum TaxID=4097 RepID=A0A1S4AJ45_TOBAC|nr:protein LAZ1 homolog 2 isoform X1 [Nicotiana tomentosiformis]XP_016476443.1 PREDICTED: protein LAZ1 homolog 2-like [Nicotiana tabacum]
MASFYISLYVNMYRDLHEPALVIAGCFVLVALILSLLSIFQHLRYYTNPAEQKWIVGVLFMVPVYATESILSLWNPKLSLACDILRNCYEAFALYSFGSYLIACLGGEREVVELLEDERRKQISQSLLGGEEKPVTQKRTLYNFIFHPCVVGKNLFTIEKFGLVQYMILKTTCAFLALIMEIFGVYGDGEFKWHYGYPYITVVLNFSQMWALFCLVQFYNATHHKLQSIKPLAKFISFKAIVFATWWQGVGIALICYLRVLPKEGKFQTGLQDFLICIEMAIAAIAHVFVFSAKPYHFVPTSVYEEITAQKAETTLKSEDGEKPAVVEKIEAKVELPGTSVTESVQDIVVEGGQKVVKDVVLTINQAMEPVEKGMTKIQETFHQISVNDEKEEKQETEIKIEEHEQNVTGDDRSHSQVLISRDERRKT